MYRGLTGYVVGGRPGRSLTDSAGYDSVGCEAYP